MNINEFKSEIELRKSFKCETFKGNSNQVLVIHYENEKITVPFNNYTSELEFSKAKQISEEEYMQMKSKNDVDILKNNYYFSK